MKKIINGRRYDTTTAKEIGNASYSGSVTDFQWWDETLYLKRTGEFFIYGEGGPASKYSRSTGQNSWSGGEKIIPLSIEEAKEWAEKYLDADEYEELFKVEEDKTLISIWIPDSTKADADKLREKGYTLADIFKAGVNALTEDQQSDAGPSGGNALPQSGTGHKSGGAKKEEKEK